MTVTFINMSKYNEQMNLTYQIINKTWWNILYFHIGKKKAQFITVWWYFCSSLLRNSCMESLWCLQPMLSYWAVKMKFNILQPWAALWRCFWEHCAKTHMLSCPWICLVLLWNWHEPLATDPKWRIPKNSSTLSQVSLHLRLKGTLAPSVALCTCACLRQG